MATTKKTPPVPAKKSDKVKSTPAKASKSDSTKSTPDERAKAKELGLGVAQYKILRAMKDGKEYTYRDIEEKTGYYNTLTKLMRAGNEGSLCDQGFIKEKTSNTDGREKLCFVITDKGKKLINK